MANRGIYRCTRTVLLLIPFSLVSPILLFALLIKYVRSQEEDEEEEEEEEEEEDSIIRVQRYLNSISLISNDTATTTTTGA